MKLTIVSEGRTATLDEPVVHIEDVARLVKDALLAVGFHESTVALGFYAIAEEIDGTRPAIGDKE